MIFQTVACELPESAAAVPTATLPSGESAATSEFPELSLLSVPKSVFVAQCLPDQMMARVALASFRAAPPAMLPSAESAATKDAPELSLLSDPKFVFVAQLPPDQMVAS